MDITNKIIDQFESRKSIVDIDIIKQYNFNNKEHTPEQIELLAKNMQKFGFTMPLVIDKDHVIVVGHGRYLSAKKLGYKEIPVIKIDDLSDAELKEYRLLDNKVTDMGVWNMENLAIEMKELGKRRFKFYVYKL